MISATHAAIPRQSPAGASTSRAANSFGASEKPKNNPTRRHLGGKVVTGSRNMTADNVLDCVRRTAYLGNAELSDAQLLDDFIVSRTDAAFAELVRRHGPMVLAVCR